MSNLRRIDNHDDLQIVRSHPSMTEGELTLLGWQYHHPGGFYTALWKAISVADMANLERLRKGYPSEVQAYDDCAHTGVFGKKVDRILRDHDSKQKQQKGN